MKVIQVALSVSGKSSVSLSTSAMGPLERKSSVNDLEGNDRFSTSRTS